MDIPVGSSRSVIPNQSGITVPTPSPPRKKFIIFSAVIATVVVLALSAYFFRDGLPFMNKMQTVRQTASPTPKPSGIPREAIMKRIGYTGDIPVIYEDLNTYLKSKGRPVIVEQEVTLIDNKTLLEKLNAKDENLIVIDIREKRETEVLLRLNDYPNLRYIRLGDIINSNFENIPKDAEIVIAGFTENRAAVASDYLLTEGYTNVKVLKGGLLEWAMDNLPTTKNRYTGEYIVHNDINAVLPFIDKPASSSAILRFGRLSPVNITLLVWDSNTLKSFINSLPPEKEYILFCEENKFCYEASHFWYEAKDKIKITGYSGYARYAR